MLLLGALAHRFYRARQLFTGLLTRNSREWTIQSALATGFYRREVTGAGAPPYLIIVWDSCVYSARSAPCVELSTLGNWCGNRDSHPDDLFGRQAGCYYLTAA